MRVGIATCEDPPVRDADAKLLIAELEGMGHSAELAVWSDSDVDWASFARVWVSSTWDYHRRPDEFSAWLARAEAATRLENPRELIEWNLDKRYLRELGGAGVGIVPTVWAQSELADSAQETVGDLGWEEVVVKPTVDLGAANLLRVAPAEVAAALVRLGSPALVQPYLPSLPSEGELSLVYMRGELSHAVRKLPAEGDFRVQTQHGGIHRPVQALEEAIGIGTRTMAAIGTEAPGDGSPLYARVDLVRDLDGRLCVIEVELIEPNLYLELAGPEAVAAFARLLAGPAPTRVRL